MKKIFVIIVILSSFASNAQTVRFEKYYTFSDYSKGYDVNALKNNSGYLVTGYTMDTSLLAKALLVKTDKYGNLVFGKKYISYCSDFDDVDTTSDGNYIIVGNVRTDSAINQYDYDIILAKINPSGDTLWTRIIDSPQDFSYITTLIKTTKNNDFLIGGYIQSITGFNLKSFLMKTDSLGNIIWVNTYYIHLNNILYGGVVETPDKGFVCSGRSNIGTDYSEIMILSVDSDGVGKWAKFYGNNIYDYTAGHLIKLLDGNYLIAGLWGGVQSDSCYKSYLMEIKNYGDSVWLKTFDCYISGGLAQVIQLKDSSFVACGASDYCGIEMDGTLVKFDKNRNQLWYRRYGTHQQNDWFFDMKQTADNGFIMTGETYSYNPYGSSVWLVKTDSLGLQIPLGINEEPLFPTATLGNAFPNPTNSNCTIDCNIPDFKSTASILLFNLQGKQLEDYPLEKGENKVQLTLSSYAAGTYLYVLAIDNYNVKGGKLEVVK